MVHFAYWIAWSWLRMSAALVVFAAFMFLIVAQILIYPSSPQSGHPTHYFFSNFAKVVGLCLLVGSLWSNHYWPRVLCAKGVAPPLRHAWQNDFAGAMWLAILTFGASVVLISVFPMPDERPMSIVELVQFLVTVTVLNFASLTLVPWLQRQSPWMFGRQAWLLDRFFLTGEEIEKLNTQS